MCDILSAKNCFFFRSAGKKHSLDKLIKQANQYITKYFDQLIKQNEDIYLLDYDELEVLIKSDNLNVVNIFSKYAYQSKLFIS